MAYTNALIILTPKKLRAKNIAERQKKFEEFKLANLASEVSTAYNKSKKNMRIKTFRKKKLLYKSIDKSYKKAIWVKAMKSLLILILDEEKIALLRKSKKKRKRERIKKINSTFKCLREKFTNSKNN